MQIKALCKRNLLPPAYGLPLPIKTLLIMKMLFILLTAAFLNVGATGLSQTISFSGKDIPLEKVFKVIKQQTGYEIFYKRSVLEKSHSVTIQASNLPVSVFLNEILMDQPLTYSIENKNIVISRRPSAGELTAPGNTLSVIPHDIAGFVMDEKGEPIPGATIAVKGTQKATSADASGRFSLPGVPENSMLEISAIGFYTFTIRIGPGIPIPLYGSKGQLINDEWTSLRISLQRKESPLDEVQIIAYGQTTKRYNTGNVSTVKGVEIEKQPVDNVLQALQGRMSGVQIIQQSGVPGAGIKVQIRGQNSIRGNGNYPLYIVDGVPFTSTPITAVGYLFGFPVGVDPLNTLNPSDIESIDVLKDADATAIYGSRGANGVVLITTKKGKKGQTAVDLSLNSGVGIISHKMDLLNTRQYLQMRREAFANDGVTPTPNNAPDLLVWDTTRYTDWQKELIGHNSSVTDVQTSVSGGSNQTSFRISGGFHRETTVFPGDFGYRKVNGSLNLNHSTIDQRFHVSLTVNYGVDANRLFNGDIMTSALKLPPDAPRPYNDEGKPNWELDQYGSPTFDNPVASLKNLDNLNTHNLISNVLLSYQLLPGLKLKTSAGYNDYRMEETVIGPLSAKNPLYIPYLSSTTYYYNNTVNSWVLEPQLEYGKDFRHSHLETQLGMTFQDNTSQRLGLNGTGYTSEDLLGNISAAASISSAPGYDNRYRYTAFFGRVKYTWNDKYLINLTGRRDGSSRFGPGHEFGNFGAAGAAWIFSKESFVKEALPFLNFGKLRGSYGTTGNDQIGDYGYLDIYTPILMSDYYRGPGGLVPAQLANPDYSWEVNRKLEAALDLGFIKDRILFSASWYRNRSSNQLVGYRLPAITGFTSVQSNRPATVQNTGWELELHSTNIQSEHLLWTSSINISFPNNKLVSYPNLAGSSYATVLTIGQPLTSQRLFQSKGVDPATGLYTINDVNKDGVYSVADLAGLVNNARKYYGGFTNSLQLGGWTLDFVLEFVKQQAVNYISSFGAPGFSPVFGGNEPVEVLQRWQRQGDRSTVQKFTQSFANLNAYSYILSSDFNNVDASFIRLKTVALAWQLPAKWIEKARIKQVSLYARAQNLFTITHYIGMDPQSPGPNLLPALKMITGGIQCKF